MYRLLFRHRYEETIDLDTTPADGSLWQILSETFDTILGPPEQLIWVVNGMLGLLLLIGLSMVQSATAHAKMAGIAPRNDPLVWAHFGFVVLITVFAGLLNFVFTEFKPILVEYRRQKEIEKQQKIKERDDKLFGRNEELTSSKENKEPEEIKKDI
eukprot:GHVP01053966.1.p1 GENE.GHVP01053966.1~~GHVP01053966.1.p1  ORF type:complete len:156 (+),score=32.95 GHVP01053966.1:211-678(+)